MTTQPCLLRHLSYDYHIDTTKNPALPNTKTRAFFVTYYSLYTPYKSPLYNIPTFQTLYKTYLVLIYIRLLTTPSKLITINNLHKTNISPSYHVCVGQTQTYQHPHDSMWKARVGKMWSFQGPRMSSPPQAPTPTSPFKFPFTLIKIPVCLKNAHSLIPSLQTSIIPFTRGISVSYITKHSINPWRDSHRSIHFSVLPGLINSRNSRSATLRITKTSVMCGWIDAYPC